MTILEQLHTSKLHREGFDPDCPQCVKDEGIDGIIEHLTKCAKQNERDAKAEVNTTGGFEARVVASEQRRMLAILKSYRMLKGDRP